MARLERLLGSELREWRIVLAAVRDVCLWILFEKASKEVLSSDEVHELVQKERKREREREKKCLMGSNFYELIMVSMPYMSVRLRAKMSFFAHFAQLSRLFTIFPLLIRTFIAIQLLHFTSSALAVQDHNQTQSLYRAYHQPNLSGIERLAYDESDFNQGEIFTKISHRIQIG